MASQHVFYKFYTLVWVEALISFFKLTYLNQPAVLDVTKDAGEQINLGDDHE